MRGYAAILILLATSVALVIGAWRLLLTDDSDRQSSPAALNSWQDRLAHRGEAELKSEVSRPQVRLSVRYGPSEGVPIAVRRRITRNLHGVRSLGLRFGQAQYLRPARKV